MVPPSALMILLQEAPEPLTFGRVGGELLGFLTWFAMFGALGFHFFVLRRTAALRGTAAYADADRRAALVGLIGALLLLVRIAINLAGRASESSFAEVLSRGGARLIVPLVCAVLLLLGFLLQRRGGWALAGLAGLVLALRNVTAGRWTAMVNPLHELAASLWIGTLFVLVVAGLPAILRGVPAGAGRRAPLVAEMVARFSNLALAAAALLGATGLVTAWRHLKRLEALWTTSYGYALDIKLVLVMAVVALGAWNWRRLRPRLSAEEAAHDLRRSATAELAFAGLVLVATAVLVSLPSPAG